MHAMWLLGGLLGAVLGAIVGGGSAMLGAVLGAALGAWIGSSRQAAEAQESALAQRLARMEGDLARLRREVAELREGAAPKAAVAKAAPAAVVPAPASPAQDMPLRQVAAAPVTVTDSAVTSGWEKAGEPLMAPADSIELPSWLTRFWAGNPLVKIGIILLFFGVASGLRLAAEYGMFPVPVRLFLAAAAALGLIGFGFAKVRDDTHRAFGLALQGGGFALLYLVAYFMLARYAMIGQGQAFALFALFGVVCVAMAAKQDGPALAVLGLSGAFLAPVLAGGGADTPLPLFSYFALLNLFILGVDWFRAWRVLNIAGFVFTLAIGMAWGLDRYEDRHYFVTQCFLVLFLVAYSAMPVLTALFRAPGLNGWRDGMLLFGTPVVGSFLQARLMEGVPHGTAWSALIAAVWYAALWFSLYRQNEPENEIVERSHLGLAIAFFTLSIPLAFGAQVTSALWAVEGSAVLWYGVRTRRLLPQLTGLLMQLAAGVALLLGWNELGHGVPVANDVVLGGALLALAGMGSSRMLRSAGKDIWVSPLFPFVWAMLWWLGIGLGEIHRFAPHSLHAPFGLLYVMATVIALEGLAAWWAWPQVRAAAILLLAALWLAPLLSVDQTGHPLPGLMALMLPVALAVHYWLLRSHERRGEVHFESLRHVAAYWLLLLALPLELAWQMRTWAPGTDLPAFMVWALALAGGMALAVFGKRRGLWPFARAEAHYVPEAALLPFFGLAILLPAAALRLSGDGSGLPYLPVINLFDLAQLAGMAAMLALTREMSGGNQRPLRLLVGAIAFLWLSTLAARIAHAWGGLPFEFTAMLRSTLFQMLLTLFWTIVSIGAMILASRRRQREAWFAGFALLGVVGGKLLLFDAAGRGTLMWTGTLIGVAVLVLAASYFAPLPPRDESSPASGA
ncbi:MAG: DUF2339 domain-containing protein [Sulfuritalea sp.]|nr:DUF2339 domain-containing protein [Sulfuritalea sp.]MDP1985074.1 DUF2339 domain-containing protein [Sulfuritalea sp.]